MKVKKFIILVLSFLVWPVFLTKNDDSDSILYNRLVALFLSVEMTWWTPPFVIFWMRESLDFFL